ncbi:GrpB family protein [Chloroflexota bacterium]
MTVTLVEEYNPEWPNWFEEIITFLGESISKACLRIEHIGSTSVPGMTAKPIIDLILVIEPQRFTEIKGLLEERGYYHNGDQGIKDREVFNLENEDVKNSLPLHHLYVCPKDSEELIRETAFREFLKRSPKYIKRLSKLKWSLAEEFNNDRDAYIAGKADLCREITEKALK